MSRNLVTWNDRLPSVLDDFDSIFGGVFAPVGTALRGAKPPVDVLEKNDAYLVEVELPGLGEKDVELTLNGRILTIASKKEPKETAADARYLVRERAASQWKRSFELPENIDAEHVVATFKNGLLAVELPKKPEARERSIEIKVA